LNIKQVCLLVLSFLKDWKVPFKDLEGGKRAVYGLDDAESEKSTASASELTCEDFGWVSTWRTMWSSAKHDG
jgi:hypothetical protein